MSYTYSQVYLKKKKIFSRIVWNQKEVYLEVPISWWFIETDILVKVTYDIEHHSVLMNFVKVFNIFSDLIASYFVYIVGPSSEYMCT